MAVKNDGQVQYGSRVLTIGSAAGGVGGTTFVAENFNVSRPTQTIERRDDKNKPSGQVTEPDFVTGSCLLQLANDAATPPEEGWEFTVAGLIESGGTPVTEIFYISQVDTAETSNGERKIPVQFRRLVN